jgi:hypothetical protein
LPLIVPVRKIEADAWERLYGGPLSYHVGNDVERVMPR